MTDDEAAAIAIALRICHPEPFDKLRTEGSEEKVSRWKVANRKPDLEIEELRSVH